MSDRLVRQHLKDVYDHILAVYPLADPDLMVDLVFIEAAQAMPKIPQDNAKNWLFGAARRVIERTYESSTWSAENATAIVHAIQRTANGMTEWHAFTETERIVRAVTRLSIRDQNLLRLISCLDDPNAETLAGVLGVSRTAAREVFATVTRRFHDAFVDDVESGRHVHGELP